MIFPKFLLVKYLWVYLMQGQHFSLLQRETEKLQNDIDKMRSELRLDQELLKPFVLTLLKKTEISICCFVRIVTMVEWVQV